MKTIQKQTLWGTIISFIGVFFGTVNQGYLIPKYLETEQLGLISILLSYSVILQIIGTLGFNNAGSKFFPQFENQKNGHNGFLFLGLIFLTIGFCLASILLHFLKPWIVGTQINTSSLFSEYFYLLYPLMIFNSIYNYLENYAKNLKDTVFGIFLSQLFNRLGTLVATFFVIFGWINFHDFLKVWLVLQGIPPIALFIYIYFLPGFSLKPQKFFFYSTFKKDFYSFSIWSLITGLGTVAIFKIDSILVYRYLGLSQIGVYNFCLLFGSVMSISYNINIRASTSFIIHAIQKEEWDKVKRIYQKSSLTQTIFGFGILILAFSNLETLFSLIGKTEFSAATWAVLIIGYTKIVDLMTGINALILLYSQYYRWDILFNIFFIVFIIVLNYLLIPTYGLNGAALALLVATFVYNSLRVWLIHQKFGILPFKKSIIEIFIISSFLVFLGYFLPNLDGNYWMKSLSITYKSIVLASIFSSIILKRKYSEDFNDYFQQGLNYFKSFKRAK